MASNIEIKARLSIEQANRIRRDAVTRASRDSEILDQTDTFYKVPSGRLKLREFTAGNAELIAYERPDLVGPKYSSYVRFPCGDPKSLHEALARSLGVRGVVQKRRHVIYIGQTRVHIDEVADLGCFLELEVVLGDKQSSEEGEAIASQLMAAFGVASESLVDVAYIDLVEARDSAA